MNIEELVKLIRQDGPAAEEPLTELSGVGSAENVANVLQVIQTAEPQLDGRWIESLEKLGSQIDELRLAQENQASIIGDNTRALVENLASRIGEGLTDGLSGGLGSLGGGAILAPWISALTGLFRGGQQESNLGPPPFERSAPLVLERAVSAGAPVRVPNSYPPVNVTVNIQALDSRSFMDRSDEIAGALRRALLESRSVRDVLEDA